MSSLMSIAPQKAILEETGEELSVEDVKVDTILAIKAGETIPIDGIVVQGSSEVDEKTLTGESFPVTKQKDSIVWAGTLNLNGYISVKTTALAENCVVAKMAKLVEDAQNQKSKTQRLIDRFAKYYTPAVVIISVGVAVVPAALRVHNLTHWFHLALVVLVSACPCGIILSTPVATFCALSQAATNGLLVKGGDYLELMAKLKVVAFDKTGTITSGDFLVADFRSLSEDLSVEKLLYWVSSVESKSSHPIASAIVSYGKSQSVEPKPENVEEFQNFPGEGIYGKIDGREFFIGNHRVAQRAGCSSAQNQNDGGNKEEGRTLGYVYDRTTLLGIFSLSDSCRSGVKDAVMELKSMGIKTAMLTGDNRTAATSAQEQLENALDEIHAELLPEDKARIIKEYKERVGPTAMVGDGVNDAPALAMADVGISMGISGSALATETGHVVLMSNDIRKIPKAVRLAKRSTRKVVENLLISVSIKVAVLAVAIAGHPFVWMAVLADVMTCLVVIFNSMMLLRGTGANRQSCFGFLHKNHAHDEKDCCSSGSHHHAHDKEGNHHHAHDEKDCCSTGNHHIETPKKCCSEKTETGIHHHSNGDLHSHGKHSSETPKQCCSKKMVTETCDGGAHTHHKKSHCSTTDHSSEKPEKCCSKKTTMQTCEPHDNKKCCSKTSHPSETPKKIAGVNCDSANNSKCSKKTSAEACDPSSGAHSHLELIDNETWKLGECVRNDTLHLEDEKINHEVGGENSKQASDCCDNEAEDLHFHSSGGSKAASHVCNDENSMVMACAHTADAITSVHFQRELGSCCRSFRRECCRRKGHSVAGFGGNMTEIITDY